MKFKIFISSVQDEFAEERRLLKGWLTTDPFVSRFVENVFLFEDQPSTGKSPVKVFTDRAAEADIYIGLLGAQYYGKTSVKRGVSASEREFDAVRKAGAECLAYVRNVTKRDKKEADFIGRVGRCVTWSSYAGFPELRDAVFGSLVDFLDKKKLLLVGDFDCEVNPEVRVSDISPERVAWYIEELHAHGKKSIPLAMSVHATTFMRNLLDRKGDLDPIVRQKFFRVLTLLQPLGRGVFRVGSVFSTSLYEAIMVAATEFIDDFEQHPEKLIAAIKQLRNSDKFRQLRGGASSSSRTRVRIQMAVDMFGSHLR